MPSVATEVVSTAGERRDVLTTFEEPLVTAGFEAAEVMMRKLFIKIEKFVGGEELIELIIVEMGM